MTGQVRRLAAEANGQHGVFTRSEVQPFGVTDHVLRDWVESGLLVPSGVRTFRSPFAQQSRLADLSALVADVGPPVWVSGATAAALHGFDGYTLKPPYHLSIPRGRRVERPSAIVHTSRAIELIDRATREGLPLLSPARCLIDLARTESTKRLTAALDSALRDGGTSEGFLHRRIAAVRASGRHGIPKLVAVIEGVELTRGGHSWLEREYLRLIGEAGLPRPITQQVVARNGTRLVRVDCRFPGTPVVVELLGYHFHRTPAQMQSDAQRMNWLLIDGLAPLQFTYADVVERPAHCVHTTDEVLRRFV